jgi:hypothetical protein
MRDNLLKTAGVISNPNRFVLRRVSYLKLLFPLACFTGKQILFHQQLVPTDLPLSFTSVKHILFVTCDWGWKYTIALSLFVIFHSRSREILA